MNKKYLYLVHVFYWLVFLFNAGVEERFSYEALENPLNYTGLLLNLVVFYLNYFIILPYFVQKNNLGFLLVAFLLSFFTFIGFRFCIEEVLLPIFTGLRNYAEGTRISYYIIDNFYWGSNTVFISSLIWFLNYAFKIKAENEFLTQEKNAAENALLKSQINPHFIFNTLNNIYALVSMKSEKALSAIDQLSLLLRFSGQEMTRNHTLLLMEISYIESFIALESLRYEKLRSITFIKEIENEKIQIAPMLLIPFVENAFKHGDITNFPLYIMIKSTATQVFFEIKNTISTSHKDKSSGIGLQNVKQRLNLIYAGKHELVITENGGVFLVSLKIEIQ